MPQTNVRVRLRPTMQSDLTFVLSLEQDEENLPFITPWDRTQHEAAIRFPDMRHFIIEGGDGLEPVGFLILIGCRSQHQSLELKRMVVQNKGAGYGRAALRVAKRVAFDDLKAHRFWLDVKQSNARAQAFYPSEGFSVEGVLREAVKIRLVDGQPGFDSLVVLSMLHTEYVQRRHAGLELRA
jgi:diamine N-acetyltransferase